MNVGAKKHETDRKPKARRSGAVGTIQPIAVNDADAAVYIGKPKDWMRERRLRDIALARLGKEPEGPTWIEVQGAILYRVSDLSAWLESKAVERSQVEWRGKAKVAALARREEPGSNNTTSRSES